ncbi:MAG: Mrp/NBP35 family ATP-binding protein [Dehalococcoidia bacterium]
MTQATPVQGADGLSKDAVLQALSTVDDPELHRDLVSLGMIQNLEINAGTVSFKVVLTTPACPVRGEIQEQAADAVRRIPGVRDVQVEMGAEVRSAFRQGGPKPVAGVRNVIAVASNKGGVGKSTVSVNLAVALAQAGARVGLLDADITGPNIPTMMGLESGFMAQANQGLRTIERHGVRIASLGFLLPKGMPVVWRGPMIGSGVKQLLHDVPWGEGGELDYLIVDLPPGTSDASMSMAQDANIAGAVIVSTPQDVALEDALKAVGMFEKLNVPVFGIVENMSYFMCPHCGERTEIFGHGGAREAAEELGLDFLGEVPLHASIRSGGDSGTPVTVADPDALQSKAFRAIAERVAAKLSVLQWSQA